MALIYGTNEAWDRLMKDKNERNDDGISYPSATNNRGHEGGVTHRHDHGHKREKHAAGDSIGHSEKVPMKAAEPGMGKQKVFKKGGRACHSEGSTVVKTDKVPMSAEQPGMMRQKHAMGEQPGMAKTMMKKAMGVPSMVR